MSIVAGLSLLFINIREEEFPETEEGIKKGPGWRYHGDTSYLALPLPHKGITHVSSRIDEQMSVS
jgi:hypothetical protein